MKTQDVERIIAQLRVEGYEKEVPTSILRRKIAEIVGIDKYKIKYTLETLVELGFFSTAGMNVLTIEGIKK